MMIYPNPLCPHSMWEEAGVPGENPRLSAERSFHLSVMQELYHYRRQKYFSHLFRSQKFRDFINVRRHLPVFIPSSAHHNKTVTLPDCYNAVTRIMFVTNSCYLLQTVTHLTYDRTNA